MSSSEGPGASPSDWYPGTNTRECPHPECEAIANVAWGWVDLDTTTGTLTSRARVQCASGHWYTVEDPPIPDPETRGELPPDLSRD